MSRSARRKTNKRNKFNLLHLVLGAMLVVAVTATLVLITDTFGFASQLRNVFTSDTTEMVDEDGITLIEGNYTIDTAGERLEDARIMGDLYLASEIGNGSVDLINVTVEGSVLVQGGGMNTIFMKDCYLKEVKLNRPDGRVRMVASGESVIYKAALETSARLVENLDEGADGFRLIEVITTDKVELSGIFDAVHISMEEANVEIDSDVLDELVITRSGSGAVITNPDGMMINSLYLDGPARLTGWAGVDIAYLAGSGRTELNGNYSRAIITSEAGSYDLLEGSAFAEMVIEKEALNNSLNLEPDLTVALLELNEAVQIKGEGTIEKVVIGASGTTMEQIPGEIEFLDEVSVVIDEHEITSPEMLQALIDHGDPHYHDTPAPDPEPEPEPDPEPEPEPEPDPDPEPEPEPDPDPDPEEEEETEPDPDSETDPDPDPEEEEHSDLDLIEDFVVGELGQLSVGKKLVVIFLNVENQRDYGVMVGETELEYSETVGGFRGEVDENDAELEKIKIIHP